MDTTITLPYSNWISHLKQKKLVQTREKIEKEGLLDEDDYGRVVPTENSWKPVPNHPNGSFYGLEGWSRNFCHLMQQHPVYVDPRDAFAGRWMYFLSRMRPHKWHPDYPYDHLQEPIEKYNIICGIGDDAHFAPDFKIGLGLGWQGLLEKIDHYQSKNPDPDKTAFYESHRQVIRSIQTWIQHHIDHIEQLLQSEKDPELKDNLSEMALVNQNLLNQPPQTLREACQWIIWYHLASRTYNRDGAGGQLDALLQPYYEKDLEQGRLDRDKARYLLACFLINDPVYWQLGGPDAGGKDQTSEISFLILEAADQINTSLNLTIRVHDGLDPRLFRMGVQLLIKNKHGWPRFSGDKALVEGFVKNGYTPQLARQRIAVGCNWMSLPGKEYTMNDLVKVNLARVFEIACQEMMEQENPHYTTDKLWQGFSRHLQIAVKTAAEGIRHQLKYQQYNEPELILNLLSHGPLEKGLDVTAGGAEYYNLAIDGAGLAIVADSLAAIQQRVEEEKKLDWKTLNFHLQSDFDTPEGARIQLLLKNSDRFGAGNSRGDQWADRINQLFTRLVRQETDPEQGHLFIPGFFSWANTVGFGQHVKATPNGRKSGAPISHGANPLPGFATDGASLALAKSIARIQPGYGNTAPMQWELDPGLADQKYAHLIGAIIKTHFNLGGTLINVNIMDKQQVLAAHQDPEQYPDLVVRVTGFTAYFSMLTPEFRQLVVDRILEN